MKKKLTKDELWILFRLVENHINIVSTIAYDLDADYFHKGEVAHKYIDDLEVIEDKLKVLAKI